MGKSKQAQRTKGNVKPSSSARAAELLASSSQGSGMGFVGFGAMSGDLGYVPAAGALEDDTDMDADFRMVLRKLSKRDATTKLKALQEFSSLCKEKDIDSVKSVLPFWPRIYGKAAIDHDRRVREATQQGFEQLVMRVRRNLAPHLKGLMGPWLVAQSDTYAPAASAAKVAFVAAFPPTKQTEALLYCKDEILTHLNENLFVQTAQTLSEAKSLEPEDMEAKYHRVVCASLSALKTFLRTVPDEDQSSLTEKCRQMVSNNKFWKYAKHSQSNIQGAFYSVLSALCQHQCDLALEFTGKIAPIVLHNLDNCDPLVCSCIWEAALYTVSTLPECWKYVNVKKGMLPGLWRCLKSGGGGNARVIYPNILPFISNLPTEVVGENMNQEHFYREFLDNIKTGLSDEKVVQSVSECNAIVRALMECVQYGISRNIYDTPFCDFIIHDQLMPLLGSSMLDRSSMLSSSPLYTMIVDLVTYLHKLLTDEDDEKKAAADTMISDIFGLFEGLNILESGDQDAIKRCAKFLCTFKGYTEADPVKVTKVKFSHIESTPPKADPALSKEDSPLIQNQGPVFQFVCKLCQKAYQLSVSEKSLSHLTFLSQITTIYASRHLTESVWCKNTVDIVSDILAPWMAEYNIDTDSAACTAFVDILVVLFNLTPTGDKPTILSKSLVCIGSLSAFQAFVQAIHSQPVEGKVRNWFRGAEFGNKMVDTARTLCRRCLDPVQGSEDHTDALWLMLNLAFSSNEQCAPLLEATYISEILQEILSALPSADNMRELSDIQATQCVAFVCDITHNFFSNVNGCLFLPPAEELLLSIFQLSCQDKFQNSDMCEKIEMTWKQGVKALVIQRGALINDGGFLHNACKYLQQTVCNDCTTFNRLLKLVQVTMLLLDTVCSNLANSVDMPSTLAHPSIVALFNLLYIPATSEDTPQWQSIIAVMGDLTLETLRDHTEDTTPPHTAPQCITSMAYTAQLLASYIPAYTHMVNTDPSSNTQSLDVDLQLILDVVHAAVLAEIMLSWTKKESNGTDLSKTERVLSDSVSKIVDNLPTQVLLDIIGQALNRSVDYGKLWSLCLRRLLQLTQHRRLNVDLISLVGGLDRLSSVTEGMLHTLQVILAYIKPTVLEEITDIQAAQILTCTPDKLNTISGCRGYLSILSRIPWGDNMVLQTSDPEQPISPSTQILISVLDQIRTIRDEQEVLLFDSCTSEVSWECVSLNIEVMTYMETLVKRCPSQLTDKAWDFILCSLVSWIQSCNESKNSMLSDPKTQTFTVATFNLLSHVAHCMATVLPGNPTGFPASLGTEWKEFFSEGIYSLVLPIFLHITESLPDHMTLGVGMLVPSVCAAVGVCPACHLHNHQLPAKLVAGDTTNLPDTLQTILNTFSPMLLHDHRAVQLGAYKLLAGLMPELSQYDENQERADEEDKPTRAPPQALLSVLETSSKGVEHLLEHVTMGELVTVADNGEQYHLTMAYLLSWKLLLTFFKAAQIELRVEYAQYMRDHELVDTLMDVLYKIMPENPTLRETGSTCKPVPSNMFSEQPLLNITGRSSHSEVGHLACSVYFCAQQDLPAILRHWYNSLDKRKAGIADRYTTKYVSPILISEEILAVQQTDVQLDNMTIKTRPTAREVVATYTVDEVSMELVVTLPSNHPLGQTTVDCGKRIGVATTQWRNWMLQLTTFLHRQNGSILDGLTLWRRNVDKRFEGVEECTICYSVIHGSNCQLPKLKCKTCKKRFHSACLYKWFSTSNNSSCPMCRNLF